MPCVKTLVSENSADFINLFHAADYKSFQIKLKRNSELEIFVESVEMSFKRSCRSAARICNKNGSFNLKEALRIKISSDFSYNQRAFNKGVFNLGIHNQVKITLAVADIGVGQSVEFFGQGLERLCEQAQSLGVD